MALSLVLALTGCGLVARDHGERGGATKPVIAPGETINLLGTEPFWGGTVEGERLQLSGPAFSSASSVPIKRFIGLNGVGFSGTFNGRPLDLVVTHEPCSDGMSDQGYPFTATLRIGTETLSGCASTARHPVRRSGAA